MGAVIVRPNYRHNWLLWALFKTTLILSSLMHSHVAMSDSVLDVEDKLKVAYLANMVSFVKWPDDPAEVVLCVSATSRLYPLLQQLDQYVVDENKIIALSVNPSVLASCHLAFTDAASDPNFTRKVLATNTKLLSITDISGALLKGHAIQLFVRNLHLRFAINSELVEGADYKISSKLLRLSRQLN